MQRSPGLAFAFHALVTFAVLSATSLAMAPRERSAASDLPQDYASARAWLDGTSPYRPLGELLVRYGFPPPTDAVMVGTNPHPPVAVLLTLPYTGFDFETALTAVWWTQVAALALVWSACFGLFRPPVPWWLWAVAGGLLGLWAPVWQGLLWGQPVGLLALGALVLWWLARTERALAFGLVLALVTLIRPFSAILIVLVCGWSFRQQSRAAIGLAVGVALPFALVGTTPWEWYRLAADAGGYVAECGSVPGVLGLGGKGGQVLYALAAAVLAWFRWRGLDADTTTALAAVAAMLAYPLAWFQYDTCLVPVVAWVATRVALTGNRGVLWGLVFYMLLRMVPDLIPTPGGTGFAEWVARNKNVIQVVARAILLGAVVTASSRTRTRTSSACGPS